MKHRYAACVLTAALVWSATGAAPRGQSAIPRADQTYTTGTTAILVDVVVRDARGRPLLDLSASDFELAEDGVRQRIDTFTRVARGGGIGVGVAWRTPGTTAVTPTDPMGGSESPGEEDGTTALVFDRLSAESLRLAQRATREYVPMNGESAGRVGVFATDPGVRMVQGYTTDRSRVRRAVADIVPSGTTAEEQKGERAEELLARRRQMEDESATLARNAAGIGGADLARNGAQIGEREVERRLVQTELNMIRSFESMDRDHQGYDTSAALLTRRPVPVVPARAQDDRLLLGRIAGVAGALGEARCGDRGGQSRARHHLRGGRERPADAQLLRDACSRRCRASSTSGTASWPTAPT